MTITITILSLNSEQLWSKVLNQVASMIKDKVSALLALMMACALLAIASIVYDDEVTNSKKG